MGAHRLNGTEGLNNEIESHRQHKKGEHSLQFRNPIRFIRRRSSRERKLNIEAHKFVSLTSASDPTFTIVNSPLADLHKLDLKEFYGGKPILFVYLSEIELTNGTKVPAGFYTVHLHGDKGQAEFKDEHGRKIAEGDLQMGLRPPGGVLAKKKSNVDIKGPELCWQVCVKVCLTVEIDIPGPYNPEASICIEIVIKI